MKRLLAALERIATALEQLVPAVQQATREARRVGPCASFSDGQHRFEAPDGLGGQCACGERVG